MSKLEFLNIFKQLTYKILNNFSIEIDYNFKISLNSHDLSFSLLFGSL